MVSIINEIGKPKQTISKSSTPTPEPISLASSPGKTEKKKKSEITSS